MLAVTLSGSDCPLTTIEKHFREVAGWSVYRNGFISHYLVEPFHPAGITSGVRIVIIAAWIVPNILGYGLAFRNVRRRPASCPGTR